MAFCVVLGCLAGIFCSDWLIALAFSSKIFIQDVNTCSITYRLLRPYQSGVNIGRYPICVISGVIKGADPRPSRKESVRRLMIG